MRNNHFTSPCKFLALSSCVLAYTTVEARPNLQQSVAGVLQSVFTTASSLVDSTTSLVIPSNLLSGPGNTLLVDVTPSNTTTVIDSAYRHDSFYNHISLVWDNLLAKYIDSHVTTHTPSSPITTNDQDLTPISSQSQPSNNEISQDTNNPLQPPESQANIDLQLQPQASDNPPSSSPPPPSSSPSSSIATSPPQSSIPISPSHSKDDVPTSASPAWKANPPALNAGVGLSLFVILSYACIVL